MVQGRRCVVPGSPVASQQLVAFVRVVPMSANGKTFAQRKRWFVREDRVLPLFCHRYKLQNTMCGSSASCAEDVETENRTVFAGTAAFLEWLYFACLRGHWYVLLHRKSCVSHQS